jgi:hypothetical protein
MINECVNRNGEIRAQAFMKKPVDIGDFKKEIENILQIKL